MLSGAALSLAVSCVMCTLGASRHQVSAMHRALAMLHPSQHDLCNPATQTAEQGSVLPTTTNTTYRQDCQTLRRSPQRLLQA